MKFNIKDELPDVELCLKLKELGFPQDGGGYYYVKNEDNWEIKFIDWNSFQAKKRRLIMQGQMVKAPTVREMEEYLWFHKEIINDKFANKRAYEVIYYLQEI